MTRRPSSFAAMLHGEWLLIGANPSLLLLLLGIPIFYGLTISALYSRKQALERPAAVVDADNSALSRRLTRELDSTPEVAVQRRLGSLDQGWTAMRRGEIELLLYFPPDFSARVKSGQQGAIKLWINSANMLTYGQGYTALSQVVAQANASLAAADLVRRGMAPGVAARRAAPVFKAERLPYNPTGSYGDFLVEGVFVIVIQQLVLIALAASTALRRELRLDAGLRERPFAALGASLVGQSIFHVAAVLFVLLVVCPLFAWPVQSTAAMLLVFGAFVVALAPLAMLIAAGVRDRAEVFQLLMFASVPLFLISGFTWPLDQMPAWVRGIAALFPSTPAALAVRALSLKGGSLSLVAAQLAHLGGLGLLNLILALGLLPRLARARYHDRPGTAQTCRERAAS
jgi:ABC-2 type transport system permease protein